VIFQKVQKKGDRFKSRGYKGRLEEDLISFTEDKEIDR